MIEDVPALLHKSSCLGFPADQTQQVEERRAMVVGERREEEKRVRARDRQTHCQKIGRTRVPEEKSKRDT